MWEKITESQSQSQALWQIFLCVSVTAFMLTLCTPQVTHIELILKHNLEALLEARGMKPADLVRMLPSKTSKTGRRTQAYISRILNPNPNNPVENRSMRLPDVERVAKVFGLAPHELLTPGISRYTERRSGGDRRSSSDRRRQNIRDLIPELNAAFNTVSPGASSVRDQTVGGGGDLPEDIRRRIVALERAITVRAQSDSREAVRAITKGKSHSSRRPRKPTGPDAETP